MIYYSSRNGSLKIRPPENALDELGEDRRLHPSSRFAARSEITPYHGIYIQMGDCIFCLVA
jgi:hypothetical protein